MSSDKFACPSCGNQVDAGTSACGYCGYMFSGQNPPNFKPPSQAPATSSGSPSAFSSPDEFSQHQAPSVGQTQFGSTPNVVVSRSGGGLRFLIFFIVLVMIAATAVPIFFALRTVDKSLGSIPDIEVPSFGGPAKIGEGEKSPLKLPGAVRGARGLLGALRKDHLGCSGLNIDTRNDAVEASHCSIDGIPIVIQVYFSSFSLKGVTDSIPNMKGSNVVHRANWLILSPTSRPVARRIAKSLGAKLD